MRCIVLLILSMGWLTTSHAQTLEATLGLRGEVGSQFGMATTSSRDLSFRLPWVGRLPDEVDVDAPRPFAAFAPVGRLQYGSGQGRLRVQGAARYHAVPDDRGNVQYAYGHAQAMWRWSPTWQSGWEGVVQEAATHQVGRLVWDMPTQTNVTEMAGLLPDHTRFWTAAFLEATVQDRASIRLKAGYQQRTHQALTERAYAFTQVNFDWYQHGGLRVQSGVYTRFRNVAKAPYYGGMVRVRYALQRIQTTFHVETEQGGVPLLQSTFGEAVEEDRVLRAVRQDRFWRIGMTGAWAIGPRVDVVAQVDLVQPARAFFSRNWHRLHVGTGVQWQFQRRSQRARRTPALWQKKGQHVHLSFPYMSRGQLYIVGDFNDWTSPGIPLVQQREGYYTTSLTLRPGRYQYKILRIEAGETEWLSLPPEALTEDDGFGGINGVLIIDAIDG